MQDHFYNLPTLCTESLSLNEKFLCIQRLFRLIVSPCLDLMSGSGKFLGQGSPMNVYYASLVAQRKHAGPGDSLDHIFSMMRPDIITCSLTECIDQMIN